MTERKPPGVSFETWADKQIRDAERRGEFAALPGAGKPLPSLDAPYDEMWWIRRKMQQEGLSALPPSLVLRKEAEDAMEAVARAATEAQVRRIVGTINDKLREALRRPPEGPPLGRGLFDVEQVVADWRAARAEEAAAAAEAVEAAEAAARAAGPAADGEPARGGWGRLFRRRRSA
ncbi:J-domain-containing protein [Streptomyces sp. NBC_01198]|uniref:DnaJ family domain-containing protein n=1 Tax=Streptomyces sp. NBC_01198 TaxID=2903769 RepID=UPI002E157379